MQELFTQDEMANLFLGILAVLLIAQIYVLIRIRGTLKRIASSIETFFDTFSRSNALHVKEEKDEEISYVCQFCKHRLAYIHSSQSKDDWENFYYRCGLQNIRIRLNDSCERFELDDLYLE